MDAMHLCLCCLRCPPDRDVATPYTHSGKTEIYSDMLKECFDLHLAVEGDGSCGICCACVGRLRDASEFKLQVQRSQSELQARLQGALCVKEEEPAVEPDMEDGDGTSEEPISDEETPVKPEMLDDAGHTRTKAFPPLNKILDPRLFVRAKHITRFQNKTGIGNQNGYAL